MNVDRFRNLLLGIVSVGFYLPLIGAAEGSAIALGILTVLAGAGAAVWAGNRVAQRRAAAAAVWTPSTTATFRPAAAHAPATSWQVARALSRAESRQLTGSVAMGAGIGFCLLVLLAFGVIWGGDFGGEVSEAAELAPILVHPLAGMVVLATFRARTRERRDGTSDLLASCPTSPGTRTSGHLLTAWLPALIAGVTVTGLVVALLARSPAAWGGFGGRQLSHLVGAALLGAGATALGVALARWLPVTLVPIVAVIGVGFLAARLATDGAGQSDPTRMLSTFLGDPDAPVRLTWQPWLAHHLWVLGLTLVVAVLAVLRDDRRPAVWGVLGAAAVFTVAAGGVATRPIPDAEARRIAALVADPEAHQTCIDAGIPVCVYRGDEELAQRYAEHIGPVVAVAPPGASPGAALRQGVEVDRAHLDPAVQARIGDAPPLDSLPIEMLAHTAAFEGARFRVALDLVGAVGSAPADAVVAGQARGVVALWLATRGADEAMARRMTSLPENPEGDDTGRPWPDTCFAGTAPVTWDFSDVRAARSLLGADQGRVARVVADDWARWTDRSTSTGELLEALGVPVVERSGAYTGGHGAC